jgi:hypothetical protein
MKNGGDLEVGGGRGDESVERGYVGVGFLENKTGEVMRWWVQSNEVVPKRLIDFRWLFGERCRGIL